ncbi:HD domain-containing protein [Aliikangiella sp. IMCC44359]|uniref:HD domain-containing protein n=1 Tax=Aliikangiella sp. IMCC44359 TaxID=3459125 RepID=UPI00403AC228
MKKSKVNLTFKQIQTSDKLLLNRLSIQQSNNHFQTRFNLKESLVSNQEYLLELLFSLDGIIQSPKYHPESDALYHSLQVFQLAYQQSSDPELWLAALFHDVGKSIDSKRHAVVGVEMLIDIFPERILWLIEHHLDLMISPRKTQQRYANTQRLNDLVQLREWDLAGRSPMAMVGSPEKAFELILKWL